MSDSLTRIEEYFEAFRVAIARCETARVFDPHDWMDIPTRYGRLRERYEKEKGRLTPSELKVLSKVFDDDDFTRGIMDIRQIAEHVTNRRGAVIRTAGNVPIALDCQTSALSFFSNRHVKVSAKRGAAAADLLGG